MGLGSGKRRVIGPMLSGGHAALDPRARTSALRQLRFHIPDPDDRSVGPRVWDGDALSEFPDMGCEGRGRGWKVKHT